MRVPRYRLKPGEHVKASAKEAMEDLLGQMGFDPQKFAVFNLWDQEVQSTIKGCRAVALQGTRLCVRVPSVIHRQELYYSKDRILKRLQRVMGKKTITDIKFELDSGSIKDEKGGTLRAEYPNRKWTRSFGKGNG